MSKILSTAVLALCVLLIMACGTPGMVQAPGLRPSRQMDATFPSIGAQDGYIVETRPGDMMGGDTDAATTSLRVGDENGWGPNPQIVSILSFDTSQLPDDAIITSADLLLTQEGGIIGGDNPFTKFGGLRIDIVLGPFGNPALEPDDFQQPADMIAMGPYFADLAPTYTFSLPRTACAFINRWPIFGGLTQLRLHFTRPSLADGGPHYIHFSSGDEPNEALRPKLIVQYRLPSRINLASLP